MDEIRDYFIDIQKKKDEAKAKAEQGIEEEEEPQEDEHKENKAEEEKKNHYNTAITRRQRAFVKRILEKARHFAGSSFRELKLLVLGICLHTKLNIY